MGVNSNLDCEQRLGLEEDYNYTVYRMNKDIVKDAKPQAHAPRKKYGQLTITGFFKRTTGVIFN